MECGRLKSGLRWSAFISASSRGDTSRSPSFVIQDAFDEDQCPENDNYLITFPDSDTDSAYEQDNAPKLCYHDNPLFIPPEVFKGEISGRDELMKSRMEKFGDYKFCEAVNDFDIELEGGEAVPIVYLSTTRAAKLERSFRLAGYKKVGSHS
ncbi:hypothetical protein O0L34_g14012 [Tuta absoluta]|nr:hypothetical protein O0L34_g14012 [Tuta absoluta]